MRVGRASLGIFAIFLFLFLASNAFATVTISDQNLSCTNTGSDANCRADSTFTLDWKVTDTNNVTSVGVDWNYVVCYNVNTAGTPNCEAGSTNFGSGDLNVLCGDDPVGNDFNFVLGRNCQITFTIPTATAFTSRFETYDLNITVWDYNVHFVNAVGSGVLTFDVEDVLANQVVEDAMRTGTETMETLSGYIPIIMIALIMFLLLGAIIAFMGYQQGTFSIQEQMPTVIFLILGIGVAIMVLIFILVLMSGVFVAVQ